MSSITAHMIVKNEDQWVYYAIHSVLPYVDQFLLIDTGSSDHTIELIRSIKSPKIQFSQHSLRAPADLTALRNNQLKQTQTDWVWIVDGDEIYPDDTAHEVVKATTTPAALIAVRRYDLLGDIYHRQRETVGSYQLFGETGHLVSRLFHLPSLPNLHYRGDYPLEGLYYRNDQSTQKLPLSQVYKTRNYLYHAMYLRRSSLGSNLPMFNRGKYKIENGLPVTTPPPAVFALPRPVYVQDPLSHRSLVYQALAAITTPVKRLKRALL